MSDPSPSSSEDGFVPFRAATAIAGGRGQPDEVEVAASPPPLPPPPPGVEPRTQGESPAAAERPPPPRIPGPGATRAEALGALVDWCGRTGLARGGMLARRDGTVVESRGVLPVEDAALLARRLCAALAAAREAGGREPVAAAIDLGTAWITGFAVDGPEGAELVCGLWGAAPLRGTIRVPVARWLGSAIAMTDP